MQVLFVQLVLCGFQKACESEQLIGLFVLAEQTAFVFLDQLIEVRAQTVLRFFLVAHFGQLVAELGDAVCADIEIRIVQDLEQ